MKKLIMLAMVLAMIVMSVGSASAYLHDYSLIGAFYSETEDAEVLIGLDTTNNKDWTAENELLGTLTANISLFDDVQFYATESGTQSAYFATVNPLAPIYSIDNFTSFYNAGLSMHTFYDGTYAATGETNVHSATNSLSFARTFNGGSYAGVNDPSEDGAGSLEVAFDALGYVDMYLYSFDGSGNLVESSGTPYLAVITVETDGDIWLNQTRTPEVPIPGAVWLLGSGILGIVGLRRKNR